MPLVETMEPQPVSYVTPERGVSRRSFRLLLFLTFINTILLGVFVLGPGLGGFLRQQWTQFQERREAAKSLALARIARLPVLAAQQQCMIYAPAARELRYAEDTEGIRMLEATGHAKHFSSDVDLRNVPIEFSRTWLTPTAADDPPCTVAMPHPVTNYGVLFGHSDMGIILLHEMRADPDSEPRLVVVEVQSQVKSETNEGPPTQGEPANFGIFVNRVLNAVVLQPATADADLSRLEESQLKLPARDPWFTLVTLSPRKGNRSVTADFRGQLRIYAGTVDAKDSSRFTIPYELDSMPGVIEGKLNRSNTVYLQPRGPLAGVQFDDSSNLVQTPSPLAHVATRPLPPPATEPAP